MVESNGFSSPNASTQHTERDIDAHENCDTLEITLAERKVQKYLASFLEKPLDFGRQRCCNSSQSLYCKDCLRLLVPCRSLPVAITSRWKLIKSHRLEEHNEHCKSQEHFRHSESEKRPLQLPFDLQIVLSDRRGSATGLHAVALLDEKRGRNKAGSSQNGPRIDGSDHETSSSLSVNDSVTLIDLANGGKIPRYQHVDSSGTFLLFPSSDSVPLESVAMNVRTLVVLDCKWTKNKRFFRENPELLALQKVHLSSPPRESYYWRWHNAGPGMISTIEAIYYAAYEVSQQNCESLHKSNQIADANLDNCFIDQDNLLHLLWLFGHQRAATFRQVDGTPAPCSEEGKAHQRSLRKQKGTWRQLRHKGDELRLRERKKGKEEKEKALSLHLSCAPTSPH